MRLKIYAILIFISGWIGGCLFIAFVADLSVLSNGHLRGPRIQYPVRGRFVTNSYDFNSSYTKIDSEPVTEPIVDIEIVDQVAPEPAGIHYIPTFPKGIQNESAAVDDLEEEEFIAIYMDWPLDSRFFTEVNYLCLESLLLVYPAATFRFLLPTLSLPNLDQMQQGYLHSFNSFAKYSRLGYDFDVSAVGSLTTGIAHKVGKSYWAQWGTSHFSYESSGSYRANQDANVDSVNSTTTSGSFTVPSPRSTAPSPPPLPYHVLMFIRLAKLWKLGGLFSDLSFVLLGSVSKSVTKQVNWNEYNKNRNY